MSNAIPVVWGLSALMSFRGAPLIANTMGVPIDVAAVEEDIRSSLDDQEVSVDVTCPSKVSAKPGTSFQCIASAYDEQAVVDVTMQNASGDIVWVVRG